MVIALLPRQVFRRLPDPAAAWHANVVASHAVLLAVAFPLATTIRRATAGWPHVCLGRLLTGWPGPGCGITTSLDGLARGDLAASVAANPAGVVLAVAVALQLVLHGVALVRADRRPACNGLSRAAGRLVVAALAAVWACRGGGLLP